MNSRLVTFVLINLIKLISSQNNYKNIFKCDDHPDLYPEAMVTFNNQTIVYAEGFLFRAKMAAHRIPVLIDEEELISPLARVAFKAAFAESGKDYVIILRNNQICQCSKSDHKCSGCLRVYKNYRQTADYDIQSVGNFDEHGGKIVIVHLDKSKNGKTFESVLDLVTNKTIRRADRKHQVAPTAMALVKKKNEQESAMLVCFKSLCGYYDVNVYKANPVVVDKKVNYFWSRSWLGCQPELCFDGSLDGAFMWKDKITLLMGRWATSFPSFPGGAPVYVRTLDLRLPNAHFDAAFTARDRHHAVDSYYLFEDTFVHIMKAGEKAEVHAIGNKFPQTSGPVDAAFTDDSGLAYLLQGKVVTQYLYDGTVWKSNVKTEIGTRWRHLPIKTEAALNVKGKFYFFKDNFYYNIEFVDGSNMATAPKLMQGDLYQCQDQRIADIAGKILNIHNIAQLKTYRQNLIGAPSGEPETVLTTGPMLATTPTGPASTDGPPDDRTRNIGLIVGLVLALVAVILGICITLYLVLKRRSAPKSFSRSSQGHEPISDLKRELSKTKSLSLRSSQKMSRNVAPSALVSAVLEPENKGVIPVAGSEAVA
ncbi:hypothetical protein HDE_13165 [Halotydeus destructor]|nr:hypothetical protein HDE_13165 [Halotydeus destructor]